MKLKGNLVLRKVGKDYIIIAAGEDRADGTKVYTLNETAAWLWKQLEGKDFSEKDIEEELCSRYEVEGPRAAEDAAGFMGLMEKQGLVEK